MRRHIIILSRAPDHPGTTLTFLFWYLYTKRWGVKKRRKKEEEEEKKRKNRAGFVFDRTKRTVCTYNIPCCRAIIIIIVVCRPRFFFSPLPSHLNALMVRTGDCVDMQIYNMHRLPRDVHPLQPLRFHCNLTFFSSVFFNRRKLFQLVHPHGIANTAV